jgi:predicted lipoprotein with Yx(FWY)xxD motif
MTRSRTAVLALTAAGALTFLAGCAGSSGTSSAAPAGPVATSAAPLTSAAPAASAADGALRLSATNVANLGSVVTDTNGMTLYRFDKDVAKPPASNCEASCATAWPPVLAGPGPVQLTGIDQSLVGTVTRKDGSRQITVAGWPVYRFAKDSAPGEAKGQGVNGTWFAVTPQGRKAVVQQAPAAANNDSGYQGGYGY